MLSIASGLRLSEALRLAVLSQSRGLCGRGGTAANCSDAEYLASLFPIPVNGLQNVPTAHQTSPISTLVHCTQTASVNSRYCLHAFCCCKVL